MSGKSRRIVYSLVILSVLVTSIFCFPSCNRDKMYEDYKDYGNGYEAGKKGKSAPSLWASSAEKKGYEAGLDDLSSGVKSPLIEFQYTKEEIKSLENRWSTVDEMVSDAFNGDREAMFAVGLIYLYGGKGFSIDISKANMFFGKAASLGHSPSLDKIRAMYLEDNPNPFLHHVYVNLAIAMGHSEYTLQYHRIRLEMVEKFGEHGKPLVEEIERIAEEKLKVIYENLDKLELSKKSKASDGFFLELDDIIFMDSFYDLPHWLSIAGISDKLIEEKNDKED